MSRTIWIFLLVAFTISATALQSTADNKASVHPRLSAPFMAEAPTIDGIIHNDEWETLRYQGLNASGQKLEQREVTVWIGCDRKTLYIAMRSEVHPENGVLSRSKPVDGIDANGLTLDDSIEIWLDPASHGPGGDAGHFYRIAVNANGAINDSRFAVKDAALNKNWRGSYQTASSVQDGFWHMELAIDLKPMGLTRERFDHPWGIRVCRNFQNPWMQVFLNPGTRTFIDLKTMPLITFKQKAPVVQQLTYRSAGKDFVDMTVQLSNTTAAPLELNVSLGHNELDQPRYYLKETVQLPPGNERTLQYTRDVSDPKSYMGVSEVSVTSSDGEPVFLRDYAWFMSPQDDVWSVARKSVESVLDFGYYPYKDTLKVRLDLASAKLEPTIEHVDIQVRARDASRSIFTQTVPVAPDAQTLEQQFHIPELATGEYELHVSLRSATRIEKSVVKHFERTVFDWERNTIGVSDEVVPPFTPIQVDGNTVKTVLRQHDLSPFGLWNQVTSKGQDVLARPIRYAVTRDGKSVPMKAQKLTFTQVAGHKASGVAAWQCGELNGETRFEFDYDGMMKVTLRLVPQGPVELDRFRLEIPLKLPAIPLMHVVTDGIRMTESTMVPEGTGVVWRSLQANRNFLQAPFVPYIYVGGPERGIVWFADTDKGWLLDRKKDAAVITRNGDVVTLNVDFVNTTSTIDEPLEIVFGLQATPVKPMPENWRQWGVTKNDPYKWMMFGAAAYWSGPNVALWPYKRDFTILDQFRLARETGKIDPSFVKKLVSNFDQRDWYKHGKGALDHFKSHVSNGYGRVANFQPDALTTYTNPTGALMCTPEWWTFQDEWSFDAYRTRESRADERTFLTLNEARTNLSKSRIDFKLWYYKRLMEACMDGIYWDNMYPHSIMDEVMSDAYRLADGRIQPSVNIFAQREMVKRTAVLSHQMGKPRCNMVHMTTSNLVPVFAFADMTLDWEWKYGMDDFQERFTEAYILTESTGLQTGCIPFVLSGILGDAPKSRIDFVLRTFAGWSLVHELKPMRGLPAAKTMTDFGYGQPNCKVFNWWQPSPPVSIQGESNAKFLLLQNDGKLLILVVSAGESAMTTVSFNTESLLPPEADVALDAESQKMVPIRDGAFGFMLPKHDYRIFIIE